MILNSQEFLQLQLCKHHQHKWQILKNLFNNRMLETLALLKCRQTNPNNSNNSKHNLLHQIYRLLHQLLNFMNFWVEVKLNQLMLVTTQQNFQVKLMKIQNLNQMIFNSIQVNQIFLNLMSKNRHKFNLESRVSKSLQMLIFPKCLQLNNQHIKEN